MPKTVSTDSRESAIDRKVGENLRRYRTTARMSQTGLADALGITFQQVQKYEKGTNRVSASKLLLISECLGVKISDLFDGAHAVEGRPPAGSIAAQLDARSLRLATTFNGLSDKHKTVVQTVVRSLSAESPDNEAEAAA